MKKLIMMIIVPVLLFSIVFCGFGCSNENNTEESDTMSQTNTGDSKDLPGGHKNTENNEEKSNDGFVSVWPDELPFAEMNGYVYNTERPIQFTYELSPGMWTFEYNYKSMYLYDFPDPEPYFHKTGNSYKEDLKAIYFEYDNVLEKDETERTHTISKEDFDSFINAVIEAGYTDNSVRTERKYYCEKYGVGITIVLANAFPFTDDAEELRRFQTEAERCYVKLQLIDPDYVMDLEQIKAEEYQKWLEKH